MFIVNILKYRKIQPELQNIKELPKCALADNFNTKLDKSQVTLRKMGCMDYFYKFFKKDLQNEK